MLASSISFLLSTRYILRIKAKTYVLFSCPAAGLCSESTNGFLTQSEVQAAAKNNKGVSTQDRIQLLFPSINFTESQSITAWSFVVTQSNDPSSVDLPQLQVWTPAGIANSFIRIAAVGDTSILQGTGPLYRYVLPTPIPVSPGDVLGIYIPRTPALFPRFWDVGVGNTATYYFNSANNPQTFITINLYTPGSQLIPFVAVQFGKSYVKCIFDMMCFKIR